MCTPNIGLANWFLQRSLRTPERPALVFDGQTWSYPQMQQHIEQLAARSHGMGFGGAIEWLSSLRRKAATPGSAVPSPDHVSARWIEKPQSELEQSPWMRGVLDSGSRRSFADQRRSSTCIRGRPRCSPDFQRQ